MSVLLTNRLNGVCSAKASSPASIVYAAGGMEGTCVEFANLTDYLLYDNDYFAAAGTASICFKPESQPVTYRNILDTIGENAPVRGSLKLEFMNSQRLRLRMHDGTNWRVLSNTRVLTLNRWYRIAISWGPKYGLRLYINGVPDGSYETTNYFAERASSQDVYIGDYPGDGFDNTAKGWVDIIQSSDVENDDFIINWSMPLRIHSYSMDPEYDFDFEYYRSSAWYSLKTRVDRQQPITVSKNYKQMYSASLVLDNIDGLLSPENTASAYNLNGATYDCLLDEARKVRLWEGIKCFPNVSDGKTVVASVAPTTGDLQALTDGLIGDVKAPLGNDWVRWHGVAADAEIRLRVDLGENRKVQHGMIAFLSNTGAATPVALPATVLFEYSLDTVTWYPCGPAFDMSEYNDSADGQRFLAWFTDLNKTARYIRATITNISSSNAIYVDEINVWSAPATGYATKYFLPKLTFSGYLGDDIQWDNGTGLVALNFLDERKKEADNRLVELTEEYTNQYPEAIIYDLLTNTKYWTGAPGHYDAPLGADEIGWEKSDILSRFVVTKWQGQQGTILDYISELAGLIGWVYDCDGDGKRQFYEPEHFRTIAHPFMNFFGDMWGSRGAMQRNKTGNNIRNHIRIVGVQGDSNVQVPYDFKHPASIARYGTRYGRITEPLVKNPDMAAELGRAILRDYAYARDGYTVAVKGNFDIERPAKIQTFNEPIRAFVDKDDLWVLDSVDTELLSAGKGKYTSFLQVHDYISSPPKPVRNVACAGASGSVTVSWTAADEGNIAWYRVYYASGDDPDAWSFTAASDTSSTSKQITGLTNGTAYWFYVTAISTDGTEGWNSAIVRCIAGAGNTGTENKSWQQSGAKIARVDSDIISTRHIISYLHESAGYDTGTLYFKPDRMLMTIAGPVVDPEAFVTKQQIWFQPTRIGVLSYDAVLHSSVPRAAFSPGTTTYWRLMLHSVVIRGVVYTFGTPLMQGYDYYTVNGYTYSYIWE